jgi:hypothetical protein
MLMVVKTFLGLGLLVLAAPVAAVATVIAAVAPSGSAAVALDAAELDVRDLTTIEWKVGDTLPETITKYDGKRVVIRGYMHQSITDTTTRFPLVADSCQCADTLLPHHFIDVELKRGDTGPIPGEFEVLGKLSIGEVTDEDGFVVTLYRLSGEIY